MIVRRLITAAAVAAFVATTPAAAQSSARKAQERGTAEIPHCTKQLGTIAIIEPDNQWWREMNLGSPEAILRVFVQQSGCFRMVNRGAGLQSRAMERALADNGELQRGSNIGQGQVRAADYFLQPDIVTANRNSGGMNLGGIAGGLIGGFAGAVVGGINVKKKEANVTLTVVNARTTEEEALVEGFAKKSDIGFGGGAGGGWWGGFAGAGGSSYANTEIGQVIVMAYLDAYTKLVTQLGGLPDNASASAPQAPR